MENINDAVAKLSIESSVETSTHQCLDIRLVNEAGGLGSMLATIYRNDTTTSPFCLDLEGVNLSRHGSISLLQIWGAGLEHTFIVDVHVLGKSTFERSDDNGNTLKQFLEASDIEKYFFDVRNDADALYSHFGIILAGVKDVQLLELATRRYNRKRLKGLAKCIDDEKVMSKNEAKRWQEDKEKVTAMFDPKMGGSYEIWNKRPILNQDLIRYAVGDVRYLLALAAVYEGRLKSSWVDKVTQETQRRLMESRSSTYEPGGRQKALGPKSWQPKPKDHLKQSKPKDHLKQSKPKDHLKQSKPKDHLKQSKPKDHLKRSKKPTITSDPLTASGVGFKDALETEAGQTSSGPSHRINTISSGAQNVRFPLIQFRPEGLSLKTHRKPGPKISSAARHDMVDDNQDWSLCNKDCAWCGQCADDLL
ncbi:hypothetical protein KVT40_002406 [Elsinoe batatas]|uniref:3'-5' exonuclease domain-containing protein n=1 Tax=Elsinoe batatas TaxID=2601811 RepID=A0A8K0L7T3_9PEZI|nr:hypothetical protein KVT40_002406 [Elsinoe batatas]